MYGAIHWHVKEPGMLLELGHLLYHALLPQKLKILKLFRGLRPYVLSGGEHKETH